MNPMTAKGLAEVIVDNSRDNQRYCFILGAGASVNSGIRAAKALIPVWRDQMMDGKDEASFRRRANDAEFEWEKCKHIFREGYKPSSDDYFMVYGLRYAEREKAGYEFLKKEMKNASPSIGYYCLANILHKTRHKLVITTNFDSLTEDALFYVAGEHPMVLGHESLAAFMSGSVDDPVVAKVHRDLYYKPMNRPEEMRALKKGWRLPLQRVLAQCIPIVVGYAGGDKTLMSLLREEDLPCEKIYWCTLSDSSLPDEAKDVIEKHNGRWVQIDGFDDLMFLLASGFGVVPDVEELKCSADGRLGRYNESYEKFRNKYFAPAEPGEKSSPSRQALDVAEAIGEEESRKAPDLKQYNNLVNQAWRLWNSGKHQEAIDKCGEAINMQPNQASAYNVRGVMLHNSGQHESALKSYTKAVELEPNNPTFIFYRSITHDALSHSEEALKDKSKAIELSPDNAEYYHSRAVLLHKLGRYEDALKDRDQTIKLEPDNARYYSQRGITLHALKRYEDSITDKDKAVALEPENALYYYSRSYTLHTMGLEEKALADVNKALELAPDNEEYRKYRETILEHIAAGSGEPAPV